MVKAKDAFSETTSEVEKEKMQYDDDLIEGRRF